MADKPFTRQKSGLITSPSGLSNNITGTPPKPGLRGKPDASGSGQIPQENSAGSSGVFDKFVKSNGS
jgi:hypothetical protein